MAVQSMTASLSFSFDSGAYCVSLLPAVSQNYKVHSGGARVMVTKMSSVGVRVNRSNRGRKGEEVLQGQG